LLYLFYIHLKDPLYVFTIIYFIIHKKTLRLKIESHHQCVNKDGFANDWHLVHLGVGHRRCIDYSGSNSGLQKDAFPEDLGIWKDEHIAKLAQINQFILSQHSVPGIQPAHAGRKASAASPWNWSKSSR
jgi:2,4-dienoyl-CoA reductase-like NADH-dependent reductase (Old Yellow Enzyme family)